MYLKDIALPRKYLESIFRKNIYSKLLGSIEYHILRFEIKV